MQVRTLEVPVLGNHTHLVHDGRLALVVDPPRDPSPVEAAAEEAGVEISAVADTHIHNDYVSGALGLARRHGADYLLAAEEAVEFERVGVRDGDVLHYGRLEVEVLATPGHTRHHQSFLVRDADEPAALFSGGSLLHGTVGRTDLVDPRLSHDLARAQWASARRLGALDPRTRLLPTHGFGSFCASTTADGSGSTVGDELAANPALTLDAATFVAELVAGFGPVPSYYHHMAPLNRAGSGRSEPRPGRPVTREEVTDAILSGQWVVDLRTRDRFAAAHVPGSVSVEYSDQFATYVGWLVPWGDDLVLLHDSPADVGSALHDLAAIGIDGPGIHQLAAAAPLPASYRRATWADFREESAPRIVVDVRQRDEYDDAHLPGAHHVPVHEIETRAGALPAGELWVHCRSGYRAGIAASLLHRGGRSVVHVDDSWDRVAELAIPTTGGVAA
ncbi:MBL fold metallo-hydrolase [Nocardioides sp. MAH-18]|uniref:MBL fold metallo-hydrolase n=1 Tax=Nocardioides agri TaxID=2682843 RepID=A0A6L6XMW5_9ACTN|nr:MULTISPECIES: rhodanese-like domain-containing protein [unclassified Nocardioides]MBA2953420.1 MBL fold metallo-hydrolase [Nocardioides sp. CGMCC 1.13656]MVQ48288.1 MBL fold metallo-hydrolase [Nocardioides sp. MAH-18]